MVSHLCVPVLLSVTEYRNDIVFFTKIMKCAFNMPVTYTLFSALNLVYIKWLYQTSDCVNYLQKTKNYCRLHRTNLSPSPHITTYDFINRNPEPALFPITLPQNYMWEIIHQSSFG